MAIKDLLKYLYRRPQHLLIYALSSFSKDLEMEKMKRILIISPHPDDEVFGCGMLMNKLVENHRDVHLVILSRGEFIVDGTDADADEVVRQRALLTQRAASVIGLPSTNIRTFSFPDGNFSDVPASEVTKLYQYIEELQPDTLFYPHPQDGSPDHCVASKIMGQMKFSWQVDCYHYCVWLWHHMPFCKLFGLDYTNAYLLKGNIENKREAIKVYAEAKSPEGFLYSGNLPKMFMMAVSWRKELYFKV